MGCTTRVLLPRISERVENPLRERLRVEALEVLARQGLPNRKTEDWRKTPLKGLVSAPFELPARGAGPSSAELQHMLRGLSELSQDALTLIHFNGDWVDALDHAPLSSSRPSGVPESFLGAMGSATDVKTLEVFRLKEKIPPRFGAIASNSHFVAVNNATFDDGVGVVVSPDTSASSEHVRLRLVHLVQRRDQNRVVHPRLFLHLRPGAKATLEEIVLLLPAPQMRESGVPGGEFGEALRSSTTSGSGRHEPPMLVNSVTEILLEEGSTLVHRRLVDEPSRDAIGYRNYLLSSVAVEQHSSSEYSGRFLSLGGTLNRLDLEVEQIGDDAGCVLRGAYSADEGHQVEQQTRVVHRGCGGRSEQRVRGLVSGNGVGLFNGVVAVKAGAVGCNADQDARTLLLSDDATGFAKPHLEIDTDDVACSHGATVGSLDETALFYLRSARHSGSGGRGDAYGVLRQRGIATGVPR